MTEVQTTKNFQAKVPIAIWRDWERWLEGRGTLNNTQIMVGLLRLFLSSPEDVQLKALFGRQADLARREPPVSTQAETDAVVADATRTVQARRSTQDRPQRKASG